METKKLPKQCESIAVIRQAFQDQLGVNNPHSFSFLPHRGQIGIRQVALLC
jgi:hypothetical protein